MDAGDVRRLIPGFAEATEAFYSGRMSVKDYKSISGGFGSYAQRGGRTGVARLRMPGGRVTRERLAFVCGCIEKYGPDMVHLTTCQSVQLHGLKGEDIPKIVDEAMDHGVFTYGGGGDYPRNVTATPLSGAIKAPFDVQPFAEAATRFLLDTVFGRKLPRKLKVGFSNTKENSTDATARDLGFVARDDGTFDVYSGGGLGANPRLGLLVYEGARPEDLCFFLRAMVSMFMRYGDYENRSKARVRYMRDSLGDSGYVAKYNEELRLAFEDLSIPRIEPEPFVATKKGDGSAPTKGGRKQMQEGLYYVKYHPLGGDPDPAKILELYETIKDIDQAEVRIGPNETLYVINLTGIEADRVSDVLSDGAATLFEASVSCVGNTICQIGLRDSHGLLMRLIDMERSEGFADGVLPMLRISGCPSSCSAHQLGIVGLKGAPPVDGSPAFEISVNGSHVRGRERLGVIMGRMKEDDLPGFLRDVGRAVVSSGKGTFSEWYNGDPRMFAEVAGGRLVGRSRTGIGARGHPRSP